MKSYKPGDSNTTPSSPTTTQHNNIINRTTRKSNHPFAGFKAQKKGTTKIVPHS